MPPVDGCLSGRSQHFTFSRRELFHKAAATLPFLVLSKPSITQPLKDFPVPEFWFGDRVSFCWNDETDELPYSETGQIIGVTWNPRENFWEYAVIWLSSTAYPSSNYPLYDGSFLTGEEMCKL